MLFYRQKSLVASGENEILELKETTGQRVDACETLCAFLNKDGGTVVFGVDRKALEAWGRGIKLIMEECAKSKLPEPQIVSEGGYTKTVFMRPNERNETTQKATPKAGLKEHDTDLDRDLDDLDQKIVALIIRNYHATYARLSHYCGCSVPTIQRRLRVLQQKGVLRRVGPDRGGYWAVEQK